MMMRPNEDGLLDTVIDENGVVQEDTFMTSILTALLLNRRADEGDILPYGYRGKGDALSDDRQGWPGDVLDEQGRLVGSRLWLLDHELAINETRLRAREYIQQALQSFIDDGHVQRIQIEDQWAEPTRLDAHVYVYMTNGDKLSLRVNYETGAVYAI